MDKKEAIEVLKSNRPNGHHETLSSAVDVAIAAIEESMVQKPATNKQSTQSTGYECGCECQCACHSR